MDSHHDNGAGGLTPKHSSALSPSHLLSLWVTAGPLLQGVLSVTCQTKRAAKFSELCWDQELRSFSCFPLLS